jgi:hypothetical protein
MTTDSEVAKFVGEILSTLSASGGKELASWRSPQDDLSAIQQLDYAAGLRALLDQRRLEEVVHAAQDIFPDLNRRHDPAHVEGWLSGNPSHGLHKLFAQVRSHRNVHFQDTPFDGDGLALRGFFVDPDGDSLKRPLIYINTAHHPVAAAATLFHEVGHLVASELFEARQSAVQFFFDIDYAGHLGDLNELTADVVLALAAYPAPVAREIFGCPEGSRTENTPLAPDRMLARILEHYRTRFGVSLGGTDMSPARKLNYLGGMIHFAKLRSALLTEFSL